MILLLSVYSTACVAATPSFSFPDTVPDVILASQSPADLNFGHFVATGGDVNGDGYDDFATTANRFDDCRGRAYLYFGGKARKYEHADHIFDGEATGDFFGMWILLADLNNDKYADVIVGAVGYNNWQGRVYVYFGGPDMDENADMFFYEESGTGSWFGRVIDAADIDRDGYTDLIINAVGNDKAKGRAYLYYGGDPMDNIPDKIFDGENSGDVFGREMDMGPDVNGDGYGDIVFGSRSWNASTFIGSGQGRAYLYYGGPKETMDTTCDKVFTGENIRDQFGSSVCLFDIDADGYAEVLVGARGYSSYQGRMYLYWGSKDMDTHPDLVFNGEKQSDFGGDNIDCGHLNDDKYGDILIGGYSGGPNRNGRVYLYDGAPKTSMDTVCDHTFTGEGTMFGWQISIGKINGDAYDDFIVATGAKRPRQPRVSRAYVYYTKPFPQGPQGIEPQFVEEVSEDVKPIGSLHRAAAEGDIDQVKSLIAKGVSVNSLASDSGMMTPLHEAAISGRKEVVEILLGNGAKIDALDNMAYTVLHRAVEHGHATVAKLLIDKGANLNAKTLNNWTPLHRAAIGGHNDTVELLIAHGADVSVKDSRGRTALDLAKQRGHTEIVELLKKHGAKE
ncbi:ankyrin repeat domain-containing protein [Planctomycetota bacterium]